MAMLLLVGMLEMIYFMTVVPPEGVPMRKAGFRLYFKRWLLSRVVTGLEKKRY